MKKTTLGRSLEKNITGAGIFVGKHKVLYYILNFTWGLLGNIIGGIVFLCLLPARLPMLKNTFLWAVKSNLAMFGHKIKKGISVNWGFSLGIFLFISMGSDYDTQLIQHEFGHSCQNAVLGPIQIFAVLIPSAIRYWCRLGQMRNGKLLTTAYDDIWFEGSATAIGVGVADLYK